jgi:hypothetical protein
MRATLQLGLPGSSDASLQNETIVLSRLLAGQRGLVVERPPDSPGEAGQKGALLSIGTLLVTAAAPEAAKALVEALKLYFTRRGEATIVVTGANGDRIEFKSAGLDADQAAALVARLRAALSPGA